VIDPTTIQQLLIEVAIIVPAAAIVWAIDARRTVIARRKAERLKRLIHAEAWRTARAADGHPSWDESFLTPTERKALR
jgi:hypothetical protein